MSKSSTRGKPGVAELFDTIRCGNRQTTDQRQLIELGQQNKAAQAVELPDRVDTDQHAGLLDDFGTKLSDLLGGSAGESQARRDSDLNGAAATPRHPATPLPSSLTVVGCSWPGHVTPPPPPAA